MLFSFSKSDSQKIMLLLLFANDNPILLFGMIALIVIGLGFMFWYFQTKSKRDEAYYQNLANQNGWDYRKDFQLTTITLRHIFTPKGKEDIDWTLYIETVQSSESNSAGLKNTVWETNDARLDGEVFLIGPRPSDFPPGLDFGEGLTEMALQFLLRATLGVDAPDTSRLREVKIQNEELAKSYLLFSTNAEKAKHLLNTEAENLLIDLAGLLREKQRPALVFWEDNLRIKCSDHVSNGTALSKLVMLGKIVVKNSKF